MSTPSLIGVVGLAVSAGAASGAFQGGVVLTNDAWNTAATSAIGQAVTVTRMFALFDEADDIALQAAGDNTGAGHEFVRARGGAELYQDIFGGATAGRIQSVMFGQAPAVEWDSYLGFGAITDPLTDVVPVYMEFSDSGLISTYVRNTASWFGMPGAAPEDTPGFFPGEAGSYGEYDPVTGLYAVFLAQLTVLGEHDEYESITEAQIEVGSMRSELFEGQLRIDWEEADTGGPVVNSSLTFSSHNPTPGAGGLFAIAGVCAARRRR